MDKSKITFWGFIAIVAIGYEKQSKDMRFGQYFFNMLDNYRPNISEQILGTEFDPYYIDGKIPQQMLDKIEELWEA